MAASTAARSRTASTPRAANPRASVVDSVGSARPSPRASTPRARSPSSRPGPPRSPRGSACRRRSSPLRAADRSSCRPSRSSAVPARSRAARRGAAASSLSRYWSAVATPRDAGSVMRYAAPPWRGSASVCRASLGAGTTGLPGLSNTQPSGASSTRPMPSSAKRRSGVAQSATRDLGLGRLRQAEAVDAKSAQQHGHDRDQDAREARAPGQERSEARDDQPAPRRAR